MSKSSSLASERERRLESVLAKYIEAADAGQAPPRDQLLAQHPDLADELTQFFANQEGLGALINTTIHKCTQEGADAAGQSLGTPKWPAQRVNDYEILGEIARGGMGIVFRVRQISLNREVALKMTLLNRSAEELNTLRRFRIEAEAVARLDHPNIVPIYEVGEMDGQAYFTMKLVEGGSLASRLAELRLPAPGKGPRLGRAVLDQKLARIVEIMVAVARAVHHAHQRGILHRDLKPANILLDSDGRPMVTDFGLAKRMDQEGHLTQSQSVVGTAAYMAPEQAQKKSEALTTSADVYSLGAVFYELLTGSPPLVGESYIDTIWRVVHDPVGPPRQRNPNVPRDLELICLKCLTKDPQARYGSPLELAEDLERWRAGEAISLRTMTTSERARRWARRNPLAAVLFLAVAILMVAGTAGSLLAAWHIAAARDLADRNAAQASDLAEKERTARDLADRNAAQASDLAEKERTARGAAESAGQQAEADRQEAIKARNQAETARNQAETARKDAEGAREVAEKTGAENHRLLVSSYVGNGTHALDGGDLFGALVWYGEALNMDRGDPAREDAHRIRLAAVLHRSPRLVQVWFDTDLAQPAAFSPDGRRVVLLRKEIARAWDVGSGEGVSAPMSHSGDVERATFSADGKRLATTTKTGVAQVWNPDTGKPLTPPLKHDKPIYWAAFSPDGTRLATVSADKNARVWDTATGKLLFGPLAHDQPVYFASFSRDAKRLVTCGGDSEAHKGEIRVWDLTQAKPTAKTLQRTVVISWAYLTPDGEHVVATGGRRTAVLLSVSANKADSSGLSVVRLDPEGAVGPDPTRVLKLDGPSAQVFDVTTDKPVAPPLLHGGEIVLAVFSPDGRFVATAARDRTARVWDAASGQPLTPPLRHGRLVHRATFSADGRRLLTTSEDGIVRVWDLASRELVQPLAALVASGPTALSTDRRLTALTDKEGAVWVRDAVTDKVLYGPWKLSRPVTDLRFAPDGRHLLAASEGGARIWDTASGEPVTPDLAHAGTVHQAQFTPDGSRVAILGAKDQLEVFDAATGARLFGYALPAKVPPSGLTLTPDGRAMIVSPQGEVVALKDVSSGGRRAGPFRHASLVTATAVRADGKRLAVATADGTAVIWDVTTARPVASLQHGQPLRQVAFSGDGRRLVTVAENHTLRVWDVATGLPVSPLLAHAEPITQVSLSADGRRLAVRSKTGAVWDLSPDTRPADDLIRLTRLLSGQMLDARSGGFEPLEAASLRETWPKLRASYPQEFAPSP